MKYRTQAGVLSCLTAALCAASFAAQADTVTLSGQFLNVTYDTAQVPAAFGKVSIVETPFEWDCGNDSCTMTAPASVSVVFGSQTGTATTFNGGSSDFKFMLDYRPSVNVVDPLGRQWGIAAADSGRWSFGANITGQTAPQDASFATAYGQFRGYVSPRPFSRYLFVPTWSASTGYAPAMGAYAPPSVAVPGWGTGLQGTGFTESAALGLQQTGWVGFGPGLDGMSFVEETGLSAGFNDAWQLRADLTSTYYATPSTTNPRCQSLSCMNFAEGTLSVDRYELKLAVVATPATVPEAGTGAMALVGAGLFGWAVRRRRAFAA